MSTGLSPRPVPQIQDIEAGQSFFIYFHHLTTSSPALQYTPAHFSTFLQGLDLIHAILTPLTRMTTNSATSGQILQHIWSDKIGSAEVDRYPIKSAWLISAEISNKIVLAEKYRYSVSLGRPRIYLYMIKWGRPLLADANG
jgi:hypothetical protein